MSKACNQLPCDGYMSYLPGFIDSAEADRFFQELFSTIPWKQETIQLFGKVHNQPRLVSWHADSDAGYSYSNKALKIEPWTPTLEKIRQRVGEELKATFNGVLLNLYRDQRDSNGWHSDDEKELGEEPLIASISLGAERDFLIKHKTLKLPSIKQKLEHGSLMIMSGTSQQHWKHTIPKRTREIGPRINLTFRQINPN